MEAVDMVKTPVKRMQQLLWAKASTGYGVIGFQYICCHAGHRNLSARYQYHRLYCCRQRLVCFSTGTLLPVLCGNYDGSAAQSYLFGNQVLFLILGAGVA